MPRDRKSERYEDERSRRKYVRSPEHCCDTETQTESTDRHTRKDKYTDKKRDDKRNDILDPYSASGRMIVIASPSRKMLQRLASVTTSDTDKYIVRKSRKSKRKRSLSSDRHRGRRERSITPEYNTQDRRKNRKERNGTPEHKSPEKRNGRRGRSRSPESKSTDRYKEKRERSRTPDKRRSKSHKSSRKQMSLSPVNNNKQKKKRSRSYTTDENIKPVKYSPPQNEPNKYSLTEKIHRTLKKPLQKDLMPSNNDCPLCMRSYEFPILLRCAHTFCKDCVTVLVESSDGIAFKCPICETEVPLSGGDEEMFCPNFVVLQNIGYQDEIDDVICSACNHEREADFYCEDCVDLLCYECADAHSVVKYTKDHTINKITSETNLAKYIKKRYFCTQHEHLQLVSHCMDCENSICKQCAKDSHSGSDHNCVKINVAAKLGREEMQRQLYSLKKFTPSLEIALMDVKKAKKLLAEQTGSVRNEISESIRRLITSLKDRERSLMLDVDKLYKTKMDQFKEQKKNIIIELEQYECASRLLVQLEKHDNSVELMQMKSTIDNALKKLQQFKSNIKVSTKTFFLKSNENQIKEAIQRHGQIDRGGKNTNDNLVSKISPNEKSSRCNPLTYIISSDFEENAQNDTRTNEHEKSARKLRTKANWMIVRSRVPDIIQFGVSNGYIEESQTTSQRSDQSLMNFNRLEQAKRIRAQANWHLLISRIKEKNCEAKEKKISPKKFKELRSGKPQKMKEVYSEKSKQKKYKSSKSKISDISKKFASRKSMRKTALRHRASANWLLVRSRLSDIADYGKITGIIPHQFNAWSSSFLKKKTSKTLLKLKHYRAIALRARANWLLVKSRLKDIGQYPSNKSRQFHSTFSVHDSLLLNRAKAARNKQLAGEVRAKANWLIVRTRLPDIVLYGKYLSYQQHHEAKFTTPPIPIARKSKQAKVSSNQKLKKVNSSPDLIKDEQTKREWHVLVHQGEYSPVVKRIEFGREKSKQHWDRLISSSDTESDVKDARKNWDILIENTKKSFKDSKRLSKSLETVNVSSYSDDGSSSKTTVNSNWDRLISGTHGKSGKKWDKVIDGSTFMRHEVTFNDEQKTLKKIRKSYSCDDISKKEESDEENSNWRELIRGTNVSKKQNEKMIKDCKSGPVSVKNTDQILKNWHSLIAQTKVSNEIKEINESMNHWNELIKKTEINYDESTMSEQSNSVVKCWDNLIQGTVATFSTTESIQKSSATENSVSEINEPLESVLNPKQEKALELWSRLISETFVDAERMLKKEEIARAFKNWDTLMIQTKIPTELKQKCQETSKDKKDKVKTKDKTKKKEKVKIKDNKDKRDSKDSLRTGRKFSKGSTKSLNELEALDNWSILIRGTEESKAFKDWEILLENLDNEPPSQNETIDSSRLSARSLTNLLKGGFKRKSITSVLESIFKKSKKPNKTNSKAHSTLDSDEEFPENTEMAGTSTNDVIENWHTLINDTAVDTKPEIVGSASNKNTEIATENWVKLIDGQVLKSDEPNLKKQLKTKPADEKPGTSKSKQSFEDITAASEEADLISAMENWQKLVVNTQGALQENIDNKNNITPREGKSSGKQKMSENVSKSGNEVDNETQALIHWNDLINGVLSTNEVKALKNWEILTDGKILKKQSSFEFTSKLDDPKSAWANLIRGTSVKSGDDDDDDNDTIENWNKLIMQTEVVDHTIINRTDDVNHDRIVSPRQGTQNPGRDRTEQQALYHWDKLIEGKITKNSAHVKSPILHKSGNVNEKTKSSVFRNWNKALARTPPLPRKLREIASKPKKDALENWNKITSDINFSKEDIAIENWKNLTRGENPYETYFGKRPPPGTNILLEKKRVIHENQTRLLNMKVKNSKGEFNNVQLKVSSPDKSILSAHIAENKDGTFTIFCCPRIDNDFNMFISLYGDDFSHEIKVLNFYGSFAGLKKQEVDLACRTISLIRWHLTPGLLVKKGNKVVAGRSDM